MPIDIRQLLDFEECIVQLNNSMLTNWQWHSPIPMDTIVVLPCKIAYVNGKQIIGSTNEHFLRFRILLRISWLLS